MQASLQYTSPIPLKRGTVAYKLFKGVNGINKSCRLASRNVYDFLRHLIVDCSELVVYLKFEVSVHGI